MNLITIPPIEQSGESGKTINITLKPTKRDENGKESMRFFRIIAL
jgi:hypothetical protein